MSRRHLVVECAICGQPLLLKYAITVPRIDTCGEVTPKIAAYVCYRNRCFLRANAASRTSDKMQGQP